MEENIDIESDEGVDEQDDVCDSEDTNTEVTSTPLNAEAVFKLPTMTKKKKKTAINMNLIENRMEDAYSILKQVSAEPSRDDCSLYAELLANKLRVFDENTREKAMLDIDNYLYQLKYSRQQHNITPSTNIYQSRATNPNAFQTYSSHLSSPGSFQENLNISPQNLTSQHSHFSYHYQPDYSSSSNSLASQTPALCSPTPSEFSIPSPYSQASNQEFPIAKRTKLNRTDQLEQTEFL